MYMPTLSNKILYKYGLPYYSISEGMFSVAKNGNHQKDSYFENSTHSTDTYTAMPQITS